MSDGSHVGAFLRAVALFAVGVALLGHGMAATVFVDYPTPATVLLPLVGAAVAYRSLTSALPPESPLSSDWPVALLATLTFGFVNAVVPALYGVANLLPSAAGPPGYWTQFLVGAAGFTAVGGYAALASRFAGPPYALAKSLGVGAVSLLVGGSLVVRVETLAPRAGTVDPVAALVGAAVAAALFGNRGRGATGGRCTSGADGATDRGASSDRGGATDRGGANGPSAR